MRACAYQASAQLPRPHDATDFFELVAHCPNAASRDEGQIRNPSRLVIYHLSGISLYELDENSSG